METSCSPIGSASHLIGEIHSGEKLAIAVEPAVSDIDVGFMPHHDIRDDGACACSDLDCSISETHCDINVAQRGSEVDVRSGSLEPDPLLLLSRDLHSACRDLHLLPSPVDARSVTQRVLPAFDPPVKCSAQKLRRTSRAQGCIVVGEDDHVHTYLRRLAARGTAAKGIDAYRYQLRATMRVARQLSGTTVAVIDLFRDASLLGRALVDDRSADGSLLSRWTLAQRRSAIRSFANLMRPELLVLLGEEPANVVDRALRSVAERIGAGYQLTGGAPRRRGGRAPSRDEVTAVLRCLGNTPGFTGLRHQAFFGIVAATGCRVNALRELDGTDCLVLPTGRIRIYLREKGKAERREVELSREAACDLTAYIAAFNRLAASRRCKSRVHVGEPGAMWRNHVGSRWGYASVVTTLKNGCASAGAPIFAPHALRRAFASDAASRLPRHVVALAGGWKGHDRLDDHYVQPRTTTIWEKLNRPGQDFTPAITDTEMNDAAVGAL